MWLLILPSLLLWAFGLVSALLGTAYALAQFAKKVSLTRTDVQLPPISILKPLKGLEAGMEESLRSFFLQDYPEYEIVFCVADTADPAIRLVVELMREYARIPTRLHVGEAIAGANPKVCNLIPGYEIARYDLLLISDSNVRVWPTYLRELAACVRPDVGVVTAVVAGREGRGLGGRLEAAYLNTCVTRWMWMAYAVGYPCVIGKTMLFRRSVMDRFGGLRNLAKYVAEDYMAGVAMHRMGYRVEVLREPVGQFIGSYSFKSFWNRHLRWGRIRHSQSPPGFFLEPLNYAFGSGLLGAWAFWQAFGVSFSLFLLLHVALWSVGDALLIRRMEGHLTVRSLLAWFLRELLALPHWLHMLSSNRILWRGHRLKILDGGLVQT